MTSLNTTSNRKHFKEMNSYVGMTMNRDKMIILIHKAYFSHYQPTVPLTCKLILSRVWLAGNMRAPVGTSANAHVWKRVCS